MRRLVVAPALALVLTACAGGDPVAERREAVADVTDAANAGNAQSLRDAVDDLLSVLRAQVARGELDRPEADRLRLLAERIAASADLVEPVQAPSPSPEPTEEPSPEPTEEPSPEPTEEPSPEPTEEPEEEPLPEVSVPPVSQSSPTPAQVTQPASSPKPKPKPTKAAPSPQPTA